jgi:hypothetical protein
MSNETQEHDDETIKLTLSTITNPVIRRLFIVLTFFPLLVGNYISLFWKVGLFTIKVALNAPFKLFESAQRIW